MKLSERIFVVYLLFVQILIVWRNLSLSNYDVFFFVCDHIAILLVFFFFFESYDWIKALINVGLLGQLFWIVDLLSKIVFDNYLFGVSAYVFEGSSFFWGLASTVVHTTTLIPALILTLRYKTDRKSVYYAIFYLAIVYALVILFTNPEFDIACVYSACGIAFMQFEYYTYLYLPLAVVLVILPTYFLQKFLGRKFSNQ